MRPSLRTAYGRYSSVEAYDALPEYIRQLERALSGLMRMFLALLLLKHLFPDTLHAML